MLLSRFCVSFCRNESYLLWIAVSKPTAERGQFFQYRLYLGSSFLPEWGIEFQNLCGFHYFFFIYQYLVNIGVLCNQNSISLFDSDNGFWLLLCEWSIHSSMKACYFYPTNFITKIVHSLYYQLTIIFRKIYLIWIPFSHSYKSQINNASWEWILIMTFVWWDVTLFFWIRNKIGEEHQSLNTPL